MCDEEHKDDIGATGYMDELNFLLGSPKPSKADAEQLETIFAG